LDKKQIWVKPMQSALEGAEKKRLWNGSMRRLAWPLKLSSDCWVPVKSPEEHAALKRLDPPELARIGSGRGPSVLGGQGS
jgi:hypothetical protein